MTCQSNEKSTHEGPSIKNSLVQSTYEDVADAHWYNTKTGDHGCLEQQSDTDWKTTMEDATRLE